MPFERKVLLPGGGLSEPRKIGEGETDSERADRLEMEAGILAYQTMVIAAENADFSAQFGELAYSLMLKGVL